MRDLGVLKERIEYAERHLKASHTARERESEALMQMWGQIRGRFEAQEQEIARFREEVAELTRVNDELSTLVDKLIATVEGSVDTSENETVPEVSLLARDLLQSEPQSGPRSAAGARGRDFAMPEALDALETDDPLELGEPLELENPLDEPDTAADEGARFGELLNQAVGTDDDDDSQDLDRDGPTPVDEDSASTGIRDLIARIEGSVGRNAGASDGDGNGDGDGDEEDDDDLARELKEIETLRNQLSGLHDKISREA